MNIKRALIKIMLCCTFFASPVKAVMIMGFEIPTPMVPGTPEWFAWKQWAQLAAIGKTLVSSLKAANETAQSARAAVDVVKNVRYFIKNPDEFLGQSEERFRNAFPDVDEVGTQVSSIRANLNAIQDEDSYNPYALQEMLFHAREARHSTYDIKLKLADRDGITNVHGELSKELKQQKKETDALFDEAERLLLGGKMTPQDAMVIGARAATQEARASVQSAAHLNELSKIAKVRFGMEADAAVSARSKYENELMQSKKLVPKDLSLNPWGK